MGRVLASLLVLSLASMAAADAWVEYDIADLGGGMYGITFTAYADDGQSLSFFANMDFEGTGGAEVQQVICHYYVSPPGIWFDAVIDNETDADMFNGVGEPPYDKTMDSWFGDPFAGPAADVTDITEGPNLYHIEAGTGGGVQYTTAKLAYIAATGQTVRAHGILSRMGENYPIDITSPEPATLMLIAAGAVALVIRRKR